MRLVTLVLSLVWSTCGGGRPYTAPGPISQEAQTYLQQLLDIMQAHSINRLTIDWTAFRARVFEEAAGAQTIRETYSAIQVALEMLGDGHSLFEPPVGAPLRAGRVGCGGPSASVPPLPDTIGYVKVPQFSGTAAEADALANRLQHDIMAADRDDLVGWIVDVRGNSGGNMWPMVAGIGPVLGEGVAGYFIDPTGVETSWEYRNGEALEGGVVDQRVTAPYRLKRPWPRVAVLTDIGVASSGEAVVISFRARPNTRSFGDRTCGLSTGNQGYTMSDGGILLLTEVYMADRTKTKYGYAVAPDESITDPAQVVERAVAWLKE